MAKLPGDATKTALAEAAARRAIVFARNHRGGVVNRLAVEEAMSELFNSPRYRNVPWPASRTVFAEVRRQTQGRPEFTLRLDPENEVNP